MRELYIQGIGLIAPGLVGWEESLAVLRGEQPYTPAEIPPLKPELLPPNERRRTTQLIKLALQVAEAAQRHSGIAASELACVFASCDGDTAIADRICDALSQESRPVSPTQFHNSVHNAPAGYWAIAAGARRFSTSISAGPHTFAAGLIEAMTYGVSSGEPVLLAAYDTVLPEPLLPFGLNRQSFGCALVLTAAVQGSPVAKLRLGAIADGEGTAPNEALATLYGDNPITRSLPLLSALARGDNAQVNIPYLGGQVVSVEVTPC